MNYEKLQYSLDKLLTRIVEIFLHLNPSDDSLMNDLNNHDKSGFTLLHYACLYNMQSFIPILLHHGANSDIPTVQGNLTPLHISCAAGHFAIVELLVRNGNGILLEDSFGACPVDHAKRNGFSNITAWLKEKTNIGSNSEKLTHKIMSGSPLKLNENHAEIDHISKGSENSKTSTQTQNWPIKQLKQLVNSKFLQPTTMSNLSFNDKLAMNLLAKKMSVPKNDKINQDISITFCKPNSASDNNETTLSNEAIHLNNTTSALSRIDNDGGTDKNRIEGGNYATNNVEIINGFDRDVAMKLIDRQVKPVTLDQDLILRMYGDRLRQSQGV